MPPINSKIANKRIANKRIAPALKSFSICVLTSLAFYTTSVHATTCSGTTNTAASATTTHLTDNNNGTINDPETGLIWKKCSEGQVWDGVDNNCTGTDSTFTWQGALQRAQDVNAGSAGENLSQTDWRLPNFKELDSIVELRCTFPAINDTAFPNTPSQRFWTSTPSFSPSLAWYVTFQSGYDGGNGKENSYRVRLVR